MSETRTAPAAGGGNGIAAIENVDILQFATFSLNSELIGINILQVQEIQQPQAITPVPRAPAHIMGLISLRGQIIPLIDLRRRLRMETSDSIKHPYHIVVRGTSSIACFEVDEIGAVVNVPANEYRPPPESVHTIDKKFLDGVFPMEHGILTILKVDEVLEMELE